MVQQQGATLFRKILGRLYMVNIIVLRYDIRRIVLFGILFLDKKSCIIFIDIHTVLTDFHILGKQVQPHVTAIQVQFDELHLGRITRPQPFRKARHHVIAQMRFIAKIGNQHPIAILGHTEQRYFV